MRAMHGSTLTRAAVKFEQGVAVVWREFVGFDNQNVPERYFAARSIGLAVGKKNTDMNALLAKKHRYECATIKSVVGNHV